MLAGVMALPRERVFIPRPLTQYPEGVNLGRVCIGYEGARVNLKSEPDMKAPNKAIVYRDDVFQILREVVATTTLDFDRYNQKWFETPEGYLYAPEVQPVKNILNVPLQELPLDDEGKKGMWVEVTVPKLDMELTRPKADNSSWIRDNIGSAYLYYSQVYWAGDIRQANGRTEYLLWEKYGALPDTYWVDAAACRPITAEEISPLHPDVGDKKIRVRLGDQTLSAYEGGREVYFCEVSTGYIKEGEWLTTPGTAPVWRKMVGLHMSAGGVSPYDSPGIGWTTLFTSDGQAIHAVYWHNNFGVALSHGCVNCRPEDAKWLWRWTNPTVGYYPGELTVQGAANSTMVEVVL